jgi:hypothetical protein
VYVGIKLGSGISDGDDLRVVATKGRVIK